MDRRKIHDLNFGNKIPSWQYSTLGGSVANLDFQQGETRDASRNRSSGLMAALVGESDIEDSCETSIFSSHSRFRRPVRYNVQSEWIANKVEVSHKNLKVYREISSHDPA